MADIQHDAASRRFLANLDGQQAELEYRLDDQAMVITHTLVPDAISGRGIAGALVRTAFEYAREQGLAVHPQCSYAAAWAERHPEFNAQRP